MEAIKNENGTITLFSQAEIEFEFDEYSQTWEGSIELVDDYQNPNNLTELMRMVKILNSIIELKKFSKAIRTEFDGDRSGEYYNITIPKKTMIRILKYEASSHYFRNGIVGKTGKKEYILTPIIHSNNSENGK